MDNPQTTSSLSFPFKITGTEVRDKNSKLKAYSVYKLQYKQDGVTYVTPYRYREFKQLSELVY